MQDQPYNNREIDSYHNSIEKEIEHLREDMITGFKGVYKRQDTTNGRIKKLELWKAGLIGATSILTMLVVPIIFIFIQKL